MTVNPGPGGEAMRIERRFQEAWSATVDPELMALEMLPVRLARAAAQVLGVDGAGISVFADDFRVPLGASDDQACAAERLQFTLGEGPCLQAHRTGRPFFGEERRLSQQWPIFHGELIERTPFRSIISLPLCLAPGVGGAVDLYQRSDAAADQNVADLSTVIERIADALSWQVAQPSADGAGPGWLHSRAACRRTRIWVAIGMLNARFELNSADALAVLRAYAYSHDQAVDDLADELMRRTLPVEQLAP